MILFILKIKFHLHEAICISHICLSRGYRESSIMQENLRRSLKNTSKDNLISAEDTCFRKLQAKVQRKLLKSLLQYITFFNKKEKKQNVFQVNIQIGIYGIIFLYHLLGVVLFHLERLCALIFKFPQISQVLEFKFAPV